MAIYGDAIATIDDTSLDRVGASVYTVRDRQFKQQSIYSVSSIENIINDRFDNRLYYAGGTPDDAIQSLGPIFRMLGNTGVVLTSDKVSQWSSDDGLYVFSQDTDTKQPTVDTNHITGILFDGSDVMRTTSLITDKQGTLVILCRPTDTTNLGYLLSSCDEAGTSNHMGLRFEADGKIGFAYVNGGSQNSITTDAVFKDEVWYTIILKSDGTTWSIRVNGVNQDVSITSGSNDGAWFGDVVNRDSMVLGCLKRTSDALFFQGSIAEVVCYDKELSTDECETIEDEFNNTYLLNGYHHPDIFTVDRPTSPLVTPTPDDTGQALHPSVRYFAGGFAGYKWWMAMTPYYNSDAQVENPCILCSTDGETWQVPDGLTNPISPSPGTITGWNSDTDLCMVDNQLFCFWRRAVTTDESYMSYKKSSDGIVWSERTDISTQLGNDLLSPSFVYDGATHRWKCWFADNTNVPVTTIQYCEGATIADLDFDNPTECTMQYPTGLAPGAIWHLGINKHQDVYYGLFQELLSSSGDNWMAASYDGITWSFETTPVLTASEAEVWDRRMYRGQIVFESSTQAWAYYSAMDSDIGGNWRIGRASIEL